MILKFYNIPENICPCIKNVRKLLYKKNDYKALYFIFIEALAKYFCTAV